MNEKKSIRRYAPIAAAVLCVSAGVAARAQTSAVYSGNRHSDFGGAVGNGSLSVTDDGSGNVTFSFAPQSGSNLGGNSLVLYLSTGATGLTDTSTLMDAADGGREAISGYNASNPSQTVANFAAGFQATYAFSLEDGSGGQFAGLFQLPPGGGTPTNLQYVMGASETTDPIVITIPLSAIGLTEGQSFSFVGSLISTTAYRSDEAIGNIDATSNPGFTGSITYSNFDTFSTPEPASIGVLAFGSIGLMRRRAARRQQAL